MNNDVAIIYGVPKFTKDLNEIKTQLKLTLLQIIISLLDHKVYSIGLCMK